VSSSPLFPRVPIFDRTALLHADPMGDSITGQALPTQALNLSVASAASRSTVSATLQFSVSIRRTIRSRPCGVRRAFLWMFIQGPLRLQLLGVATTAFQPCPG
jgi:hypothetical protein